MPILYFVRHAHSSWTPDETRPLSSNGFEDAIRLADFLEGYPISAMYTSPYTRARQTVEPLAARLGLPLLTELDLRERNLGTGPFENHLQAVAEAWQNPTNAHPGGESNLTAQQRGVAVIEGFVKQHPGEHIGISTHGNLMALILQYYDPSVDFDIWKALTNPDVYTLDFRQSDDGVLQRLWVDNI
jgi:2,3-bisphosphoglycerate-dependent phosphoglycerate mutase